MKVAIKKLTRSTRLPERGTHGAAGWDLYAPDFISLKLKEPVLSPLGFAAAIPEGYYATIVPRSSLGMQGVMVANTPGTIDSDYRGEWHIALVYHGGPNNEYMTIDPTFEIFKGERVGQIILQKYETIEWVEVEGLSSTKRGEGGFGSTGK